jgi:subtilisin family serine protease
MKACHVTGLLALVLALGPAPAALAADEATIDVIVLADSEAARQSLPVRALGGEIVKHFRRVPVSIVRIPASQLPALQGLPGVRAIEKDFRFSIEDLKPKDPRFNRTYGVDAAARRLKLSALGSGRLTSTPRAGTAGYLNYLYTGAAEVWPATNAGAGSVVAVIDTGVHPVAPCLSSGQVLEPGFDVWGEDAATAGDIAAHGTWVGGVIGSLCSVAGPPDDPLIQSIAAHAPAILYDIDGLKGFDLLGIAPLARIYPVKAFLKTGDTTWAKILEAMDHVLDVQLGGTLDIDVVNLSLGKTALYDGREITDRMIDELGKAGILVVSAAANEGPVPATIATPGSSFSSLTAGGTEEAVSSRVFYEFLGRAYYGAPGWGTVLRPTTETRIVNFSSRGPTADGRGKPEIAALAIWNLAQGISGSLEWIGGTSFATPTVAGGAALLNSYWESTLGLETSPAKIRNALLAGADPRRVGPAWRDATIQGRGALSLPPALAALDKGKHLPAAFVPIHTGRLEPNLLSDPLCDRIERSAWKSFTFRPGEVHNLVFEIADFTSKVTIEGRDLVVPANTTTVLPWLENGLEMHVQSAKRSWAPRPVNLWLTHSLAGAMGGAFTVEVEDGQWLFNGMPVEWAPGVPVQQPMEPGLMKLSLGGDFVNQFPVGVKVRVTRENFADRLRKPVYRSYIQNGDVLYAPIAVPAGVARATFDLQWARDWSRYPTSDIDMVLVDPGGTYYWDGASLNAPERTTVTGPAEGQWWAIIQGYQVDKTDYVRLYLSLE